MKKIVITFGAWNNEMGYGLVDAPVGDQTLTISGSELRAGTYLYALIADGKKVDTKRMILTK
ncbi:MAG: hypothetical protein LBJ72_12070 [Dysgonamonadaceae bacterium]|nr:hypothetical protein [Dysgonamonadaceae bacterium]